VNLKIFRSNDTYFLGTQPGGEAVAAVKRIPSPDPLGRGAPKYVPVRRKGRISKNAEKIAGTPLLRRKLAAARAVAQ
jgi:hypothetical protein